MATIDPLYPRSAIDRNVDKGQVSLTFDLKRGPGSPQNIQVISAVPPELFDASVLRAFRDWKYDAPTDLERCAVEFFLTLK